MGLAVEQIVFVKDKGKTKIATKCFALGNI